MTTVEQLTEGPIGLGTRYRMGSTRRRGAFRPASRVRHWSLIQPISQVEMASCSGADHRRERDEQESPHGAHRLPCGCFAMNWRVAAWIASSCRRRKWPPVRPMYSLLGIRSAISRPPSASEASVA